MFNISINSTGTISINGIESQFDTILEALKVTSDFIAQMEEEEELFSF